MKIVRFSRHFMYGISIIISLFLVFSSLLYVIDIENMGIKKDSPLISILAALGLLLIMEIIFKCGSVNTRLFNKVLLGIVLVYSIAVSLFWIFNSQSLPSGDQKSIYDIAVRAVGGDLLPVAPTGSYLSLWPFQSGLVLIYETILRLIPNADHVTIQLSNLVFIPMLILSGYQLIRKWTYRERAVSYFLILIMLCFPYYLYSNLMYGEIPSLGLIFFSAWMLTEHKHSGKMRFALLASAAVMLAIIYRTNTLIFVVACIIAFLITFLIHRRSREIVVCILFILTAVTASSIPQYIYEQRAGNTMGDGVPAVSYIAMGMQGSGNTPGWWNGYHSDLYMELDYNAKLTAEYSMQSIKESLAGFIADPEYALSFYHKKLVTQWCDQSYSCFYATKLLFENRTDIAWNIYTGQLNQKLQTAMNWYQSAIYLGLLCFCSIPGITWLINRKKGINVFPKRTDAYEKHILLITIIGGFLFSIFWEGGSRYMFPYTVMILPYTAIGYDRVMTAIKFKVTPVISHVLQRHQNIS